MAQLRSADRLRTRPMMEVDRTYVGHRETDAFDPERTSRTSPGVTELLLKLTFLQPDTKQSASSGSSNPRPDAHRTTAATQHLLALVRQSTKQGRSVGRWCGRDV